MQTATRNDEIHPPDKRPRIRFGLSAKLLMLTVLFVMLAQVCIYVPSIANFRLTWLNDKLSAAHTAALVFEAAPMVPESLSRLRFFISAEHTEEQICRTVELLVDCLTNCQ